MRHPRYLDAPRDLDGRSIFVWITGQAAQASVDTSQAIDPAKAVPTVDQGLPA
jgi:hypothetical protein